MIAQKRGCCFRLQLNRRTKSASCADLVANLTNYTALQAGLAHNRPQVPPWRIEALFDLAEAVA
jgi:hypothetical protein